MRSAAALLALCVLVPVLGRAADPAGSPGHPLGVGEPRAPERFTLELRFLQAARDGDRKSLEFALARGVAPNTKDDLGRNALLLATHDAGSLELVELLHARGAALDEPDIGGRAAVSWAAADGRLEILRWLAERGAALDRPDVEGRTPLFHAVTTEQQGAVEFLLDRGADANAADRYGDTPLMTACAKGYDALAELLLRRGADPSLRNQEGRSAADRAANPGGPCRAGAGRPPP
jgi:ankyrin repeat protein